MLNPGGSRPASDSATTGATGYGIVAGSLPLNSRRALAVAAMAIASAVWIVALAMAGAADAGLPWSVTLAGMAMTGLVSLFKRAKATALLKIDAADRRPLTFVESYTLTYLALSAGLAGWIVYHLINKPAPVAMKPQVVDIELTSLADFQNRNQLLPSTEDKPSLRKRNSPATQTLKGALNPRPSAAATVVDSGQKPTPIKAEKAQRARRATAVARLPDSDLAPLVEGPVALKPQPVANLHPTAAQHRAVAQPQRAADGVLSNRTESHDSPFMEEMSPPELVELVDNDGDRGRDVWQPGGRSAGGAGARSELAAYLKELNKRIKRAWNPPRGDSRQAEILFRLQKTGRLVFIKVVHSSGDAQSDEAAIKAIAESVPMRELPGECRLGYLDIKYTFNYRVDQLSEVKDTVVR